MSDRDVAIATIKAEHRALGAVLHTLQQLLRKVEAGHGEPEFALFAAALYYIDDFQERCHHLKEDEYIFKSLGAAMSEFDGVIGGLQAQQASSACAVADFYRQLVHYQGGAPGMLATLRAGVDAYAAQMVEHMRREEDLLDHSRDIISPQNWARMAAAFSENDDPLFGNHRREEFARFLQRIQMLAPRKLKQSLYPATRSERCP